MTNETINPATTLDEIFIKPSNEIKQDRFAETAKEAGCNGQCISPGGCKTILL